MQFPAVFKNLTICCLKPALQEFTQTQIRPETSSTQTIFDENKCLFKMRYRNSKRQECNQNIYLTKHLRN